MQTHLCVMGLNSLQQMERSTFHPDNLIRSRGTIIQELSCIPCQVTATLGYSRGDLCHTEYLPVYLGDEAVYLDVMGLIVSTPVLDRVDCHGVFTPIFETIDGKLIQANPQIVEVKMTISRQENLGFHEAPLDHIEDTESLLYTKAEFEAYSEFLHASRARKAITTALTRQYCTGSDSCGSYQPSEPGTFNLDNPITNVEETLDWRQWLISYLQLGGQYASVIILAVWTLKIVIKLLAVISVKKQGFNWRTAVMLNFNLEAQVRDTILRNIPAPTPTENLGVSSTGPGTGTLVLTESNRA